MDMLKFKNPIFYEDELQNTLRRGTNWSGKTGRVPVIDANRPVGEDCICYANIKFTQVIRFVDLDNNIISRHHEGIFDYHELLEKMNKYYVNFHPLEIITIVWFEIVE